MKLKRFVYNLLVTRPIESSLSDDGDAEEEEEERRRTFTFPDRDAKIREVVAEYDAVFPKLNFSSPRVKCLLASSCLRLIVLL